MPGVTVNGTELWYERRGTGEPLLMVMGMGGGRRHWGEAFSDLIAHDFDAISYDHRGIGESGPLEGELSIRRLADDALGLLDALSRQVRTCSGSRWAAWSRRSWLCEPRRGCAR
jgi:pimeloyl-ACP methyl ester carboxylesterase